MKRGFWKKLGCTLGCGAAMLAVVNRGPAQTPSNEELQGRIERLERQNEELLRLLKGGYLPANTAVVSETGEKEGQPPQKEGAGSPDSTPGADSGFLEFSAAKESAPKAPPPLPNLPPGAGMGGMPGPPAEIKEPKTLEDYVQKYLTVRLRDGGVLRPYGFFRGDLDLATSRFNDIQNPFFVLPNDPRFKTGPGNVPVHPDDFNYSLYPRLTRFGLEYYGQPMESFFHAIPSGRLETDFNTVNPGTAIGNNNIGLNTESRQVIRIRLAYAQLQIDEWTIVMGQDWDLISPLLPTINDNTLMWNVGNLGDRRPQIKFLWDHDCGGGYRVQVQNGLALADAINGVDRDLDGLRDNEAWLPGYEGRLGLVAPSHVCNQSITAGFWGFYSQTETSVPVLNRRHFPAYGYGFDLRIPICERLTFQGEMFQGRNLDEYRGGAGQGINPVTGVGIDATGGWAELVAKPAPLYQVAVGSTVDDPNNGDIATGGRTLNWSWYVSNRFPLGRGVTFAADYINWNTEWKGFAAGHASLIKFFLAVAY